MKIIKWAANTIPMLCITPEIIDEMTKNSNAEKFWAIPVAISKKMKFCDGE